MRLQTNVESNNFLDVINFYFQYANKNKEKNYDKRRSYPENL